jgi:hypothetical protein
LMASFERKSDEGMWYASDTPMQTHGCPRNCKR